MAEEVVLFPLRSNDPAVKVLRVARVPTGKIDNDKVQHIAGGPYKGIIVSKATQDLPSKEKPEAVREFLAYVQDSTSVRRNKQELRERRKVFLWFKKEVKDKEAVAEKFFRNLIDPDQFPKDYISFVKKVILLARKYDAVQRLELELSPATEEYGSPPVSPGYSVITRTSFIMSDDPDEIVIMEGPRKSKNVKKPKPPPRSNRQSQPNNETETIILNNNAVLSQPKQENSPYDNATVVNEPVLRIKQETQVHATPTKDAAPTKDAVQEELSEDELKARKLRVLGIMEDSFPNYLTPQDIANKAEISLPSAEAQLSVFETQGLAQEVDRGRWIRVSTIKKKPESRLSSGYSNYRSSSSSQAKHDFQVVPQMPVLPDNEQPTVAIITLLYCEKQAVDAMMEKKTTYVRYKTEGEGQVYTVGVIGSHKVVSTKLSRVGTKEDATISAGSSVTRLLGTFGKLEHVFLVGVGGSVPNYQNDARHVRLGDVVVSKPEYAGGASYIYVREVEADNSGGISFATQFWEPKDESIFGVINNLAERYGPHSMINSTMTQAIQSGLTELEGHEGSFSRPSAETDRLLKLGSDGNWEEVPNPEPAADSSRVIYPGRPLLFFGCIGTGFDKLTKDSSDWRQDFALFNDVKALDSGFQAPLESIEGNRKDSFWIIRGIADYKDGTSDPLWQPYASLVAAAVMKTVLNRIPAVRSY